MFNPELTSQPANLNTTKQRMCFIIINYSLWRVGRANAKQKSLGKFVGGSEDTMFKWGVRTIKWPKVCEGQQIVTIMVTWSKKLTSFQHCKPETIYSNLNWFRLLIDRRSLFSSDFICISTLYLTCQIGNTTSLNLKTFQT